MVQIGLRLDEAETWHALLRIFHHSPRVCFMVTVFAGFCGPGRRMRSTECHS